MVDFHRQVYQSSTAVPMNHKCLIHIASLVVPTEVAGDLQSPDKWLFRFNPLAVECLATSTETWLRNVLVASPMPEDPAQWAKQTVTGDHQQGLELGEVGAWYINSYMILVAELDPLLRL